MLLLTFALFGHAERDFDDVVLLLLRVQVVEALCLIDFELDLHVGLAFQIVEIILQEWLVKIYERVAILVDSRLHNLEELLLSKEGIVLVLVEQSLLLKLKQLV